MPRRPRKPLPFVVFVSLGLVPLLGCGSRDDDGPASAAPTATSIPMGAPGAEGARFDPPARAAPQRPTGIERKIKPETEPDTEPEPEPNTSEEPGTPPSPFGLPPTEPTPIHPSPPPPPVKPKGTKI